MPRGSVEMSCCLSLASVDCYCQVPVMLAALFCLAATAFLGTVPSNVILLGQLPLTSFVEGSVNDLSTCVAFWHVVSGTRAHTLLKAPTLGPGCFFSVP